MDHKLITKYFNNLTNTQVTQFEALGPIYHRLNNNVNLISRKDIDNLYLHHVLHSLSVAKILQFTNIANVIDVGTGGGFPGVPLAIMFPNTKFHLVDSINKKINAVNIITKELMLNNVTTEVARAEDLKGEYNIILGRGVCSLLKFCNAVKHLCIKNKLIVDQSNIIYLKGPEGEQELTTSGISFSVYEVLSFFKEDFFAKKKLYLINN